MTSKYKSLLRDRDALDAQIAEYYGARRLDAIAAVRQLVKQQDLKAGDLFAPEWSGSCPRSDGRFLV